MAMTPRIKLFCRINWTTKAIEVRNYSGRRRAGHIRLDLHPTPQETTMETRQKLRARPNGGVRTLTGSYALPAQQQQAGTDNV